MPRSGPGRLGGRLQEGSLYVLLVLLPFSKAAIEIAFVVLLAGWILERLDPATRRHTLWLRRPLRPLAWSLFAFLAACSLSIIVSTHPRQSLEGFIGKWLQYLLYFVMAADAGSRPGVAGRCASVIAWSSLLVAVEAFTQELFGQGVFRHYPLGMYSRMTGPYENPIDLATYLMVVMPLLLVDAARRRGIGRLFRWGVLLALGACLARTVALGVWVGFVIALAILMAARPAMRRPVAAIAAVVMVVSALVLSRSKIFDAGSILSLSDAGTSDRWVMWQAALGMIRDRPLLGHGVNTFMSNYLTYWVGGERMPRYAHNCYLQVAAETGLVGLAAFVGVLGLWAGRVARAVRAVRTDETLLLAGLLAGLAAFALHAAVDTNFYALRQAALFWVLAGVALGMAERTAAPPERAKA